MCDALNFKCKINRSKAKTSKKSDLIFSDFGIDYPKSESLHMKKEYLLNYERIFKYLRFLD